MWLLLSHVLPNKIRTHMKFLLFIAFVGLTSMEDAQTVDVAQGETNLGEPVKDHLQKRNQGN